MENQSPENLNVSHKEDMMLEKVDSNYEIDLSDESNMDTSLSPTKNHLKEFKIFKNGSKRGKDILVHNNYTFLVKCRTKMKTIWRCGKKSKKLDCPAIVYQHDDTEFTLEKSHIHDSDKIDNYFNI